MCGIAGFIRLTGSTATPESLAVFKEELLLGIESRGHDATGIFGVALGDKPKAKLVKQPAPASQFVKERAVREALSFPMDVCLLHTRAATQGSKDDNKNNHPIPFAGTVIVHNGTVSNDKELKQTYGGTCDVDSEALASALNHFQRKEKLPPIQAAARVTQEASGSMAVGSWDVKDPGHLLVFDNGSSPLVLGVDEGAGIVAFASTLGALDGAAEKAFGLGFGGQFSRMKFLTLNRHAFSIGVDGSMERGATHLGTYYSSSSGGAPFGYDDTTLEMFEREWGKTEGYQYSTRGNGMVRRVVTEKEINQNKRALALRRFLHRFSMQHKSLEFAYRRKIEDDFIDPWWKSHQAPYVTYCHPSESANIPFASSYLYAHHYDKDRHRHEFIPVWDPNAGFRWDHEWFNKTDSIWKCYRPVPPGMITESMRPKDTGTMEVMA